MELGWGKVDLNSSVENEERLRDSHHCLPAQGSSVRWSRVPGREAGLHGGEPCRLSAGGTWGHLGAPTLSVPQLPCRYRGHNSTSQGWNEDKFHPLRVKHLEFRTTPRGCSVNISCRQCRSRKEAGTVVRREVIAAAWRTAVGGSRGRGKPRQSEDGRGGLILTLKRAQSCAPGVVLQAEEMFSH